ncbi:hypothetical protein LCGC14_0506180 [marine sediment metagenome]|uniref:Tetratricopeptide repeat protein n=1 Tax=marine sediment metagenome TaxID=412755 RepID=A0A0F9S7E0_9ZZZZ|nr:MAG: hypothetical protein Lokiarch_37390 [Candidatus Lokiarchaeum sp. GC14_75]HEA70663.1 hypothetical protein [archaeon]
MVYFELNRLSYNCGETKSKCSKYPKHCMSCLKKKLKDLGFEINSNVEIFELGAREQRHELEQETIWQKFVDVLNVRHILIMEKESGLRLLSYSISGAEVDPDLLSGFIQANVTFSESDNVSLKGSEYTNNNQFYDLQYQNFNILLKNGRFIRFCLILDQKASENMRVDVLKVLHEFEEKFHKKIMNFKKTGIFDSNNMIEYIVDKLKINLVFPMSLTQSIAPDDLERINQNQIQKAIIRLAEELLLTKEVFFIYNLLIKVKRIVNLDSSIILHEIYQLFENKIIIPINLEAVVNQIEMNQEAKFEKITKYKPISSIITNNSDSEDFKIKDLDKNSAITIIKELMRKGKTAEKALAYHVAIKDYKRALSVSREYNLKEDIDKISHIILNLENKERQLELEFVMKAGENAEKNGDYIQSINFYQKGLKILEGFLIFNPSDSRIKKLKKKITKIRAEI